MRIVMLTSGNGWHAQDLSRAAAALGHELIACSWPDLAGAVATGGPIARAGPIVLDDADAVLLRTMPAGTLEQIVFRMDLLHRLESAGKVVINRPRAMETAVDKYLAAARMHAAGLPTPATIVCQDAAPALAAFDALGGDVVVKPLFGAEGVGMTRLTDRQTARRVFDALQRSGAVLYVQQFIDHGGSDLRLFVLGGRVAGAMRRRNDGWRTNIAQGGRGEPFDPDTAMCDLAVRAAAACDANVAGVDVLIDRTGRPFVLEVNAVPGWRELARVSGADVASMVLAYLERIVSAPVGEAAHA